MEMFRKSRHSSGKILEMFRKTCQEKHARNLEIAKHGILAVQHFHRNTKGHLIHFVEMKYINV